MFALLSSTLSDREPTADIVETSWVTGTNCGTLVMGNEEIRCVSSEVAGRDISEGLLAGFKLVLLPVVVSCEGMV